MQPNIEIRRLPDAKTVDPPTHHVGNPPTSFTNPWPSYRGHPGLFSALSARLGIGEQKNFVPIPTTREHLVQVRKPDWGVDKPTKLRATWFGHASFFVETAVSSTAPGAKRGIRILLDPVFANQMGPWAKMGPKRFSPLPCSLDDVPEVDAVLISHNHYDHLDVDVVKTLYANRTKDIHFFCGLNTKAWFLSCGLAETDVTELDWWEGVELRVKDVGSVNISCTPSQHWSGRKGTDNANALWCSWVVEETETEPSHKLYFSGINPSLPFSRIDLTMALGDTGYRSLTKEDEGKDEDSLPHCPAFAEIGQKYGPFDLALLPIGCFLPRSFMSNVHCSPEDAVCIHKDVRSKRSIGMHYGTIRGGISGHYEDVLVPPQRFKEKAELAGLKWGEEIGLCDIGETVAV